MSTGERRSRDWNAGVPHGLVDPIVFVGRALMAYIFVVEGYGKIVHYSDVAGYMLDHGVTSLLLPLAILTELGGGLMILSGLMTRWAAIALAGFAILTALIFHSDAADAGQVINFQKNLAIAGGFLVLAALGPGAWSLDGWRARAKQRGSASKPAN
ncbi:DoxX family protein [Methylocapsa sp. S129]|uniref:DoxX family protein n=1 Tax=Methylocapsa sp. S129 TaxID=1641869 RepID=UPI00131C6381|nr:DoxX family protein [Methylocapsa sp. S129]